MADRVPKPDEIVHNRIQLLRTERGWSRQQLADMLGVHYQTIGYLERGEYSPSLHLSLRIAALFELPVDAIFSLQAFRQLSSTALLAR
jgi:DNA-binding XRE family transcriptional regulator